VAAAQVVGREDVLDPQRGELLREARRDVRRQLRGRLLDVDDRQRRDAVLARGDRIS
jgi:hypothetical protein